MAGAERIELSTHGFGVVDFMKPKTFPRPSKRIPKSSKASINTEFVQDFFDVLNFTS